MLQQLLASLNSQTQRQMQDVAEQGQTAILHMSSHAKDGVAAVEAMLEPSLKSAMHLAQQIVRQAFPFYFNYGGVDGCLARPLAVGASLLLMICYTHIIMSIV